MLVLNLPFKALMFLTLMRPSLVLFLVLWLKLVKDFLKVRCRLALLPFLKIGRAVQQECRDRSRMPSSASKKKLCYYDDALHYAHYASPRDPLRVLTRSQ